MERDRESDTLQVTRAFRRQGVSSRRSVLPTELHGIWATEGRRLQGEEARSVTRAEAGARSSARSKRQSR